MAHKLKIELNNTDPKIYRTVIVPEKFTFHELHLVIQCVMNWNNSHLYQFNLGAPYKSDSVTLPDNYSDGLFGRRHNQFNSTKTRIADFFNGQLKKVTYIYDFGDDWIHTIKPLAKPKEEVLLPICVKGENDAPIDDIGGLWGFYKILKIMDKKRKTQEDKDMLDWYGIEKDKNYHDLYGFNIDVANNKLSGVFSKKG